MRRSEAYMPAADWKARYAKILEAERERTAGRPASPAAAEFSASRMHRLEHALFSAWPRSTNIRPAGEAGLIATIAHLSGEAR